MDRSKSTPDTQRGAIALGGDSHLLATHDALDEFEMSTEEARPSDNEQIYWFPADGSHSRFGRIRQALTRERIREFAKQWRWTLIFIAVSMLGMGIMYIYRHELVTALEQLSGAVRDMGAGGYFLLGSLIFLSAFPPMIGYGMYQTLSGFTFGFAKGYPLSYFSALAGAVACFVVSRIWLKDRVQRMMTRYPNLLAVVRAVEKSGFKLFLLIRLSPYPFNLLNVLFAATDISLRDYTLGTALTLIKIGLHIYIGANLTSFAKHILGEDEDLTEAEQTAETVRMVSVILGSLLSTAVMGYIYVIAKRAVAEANLEENDAEQMAFLDRREGDNTSLVDWMEWHDDDDEDEDRTRRSTS
ncbi:snare associated Golgi protein-domain-containing protein [Fennellomyces sp. T-0311]|nr:snare associated Golgi protein-domain-containing protein [Fennellomyces sp. T-0311]